jgi:hypothetical protein
MAFNYHDHALAMDPAAVGAAAANPSFVSGGGGGVAGGGPGWEREKAAIAAHPLYERLLEAHVACLRVATPVDQLPRIDAQIAARPPPMAAAAAAAAAGGAHSGGEELDLFMVSTQTLSRLSSSHGLSCDEANKRLPGGSLCGFSDWVWGGIVWLDGSSGMLGIL